MMTNPLVTASLLTAARLQMFAIAEDQDSDTPCSKADIGPFHNGNTNGSNANKH
jgi:hypothetical protein